MDFQVLKNAFLVALVTATIIWIIQYFAMIEFDALLLSPIESIFLAVKAWLIDFAGVFATEAGISLYIGTKPVVVQASTEKAVESNNTPPTAACAISDYQNR